jgi:radical SAM protein with 4Fe4S-binding SPASM domain
VPTDLDLLAINLTKRCNLSCKHCYLDASTIKDGSTNELTTKQVCDLLSEISSRSNKTMIVLTGGEPLLRKDLEIIISHGDSLGLSIVLGTNGTALTRRRITKLKNAGLMGVGISVDSMDMATHDNFRGKPGSWQQTMDAIDYCNDLDLSLQIHYSINKFNINELESIIDFSIKKKAVSLNIFFLVCTGRGKSIADITPEQYEESLLAIIEAQKNTDKIIIRPRCAPHYKRVAYQLNPSNLNRISGYDGDGCIAGIHYARVTDTGKLTACPYIDNELGDTTNNNFWQLWDTSAELNSLRNPILEGKCGVCEYRQICGGCRARPFAIDSNLMGEDSLCAYTPGNKELIQPYSSMEIIWSDEAKQKLSRVPGFIQKMVKKRAEAYVIEIGENIILPSHLEKLATKRFGGNKPKMPFFRK